MATRGAAPLFAGLYFGDLTEPIPKEFPPGLGLLGPPTGTDLTAWIAADEKRIERLRHAKLPALFACFGIDPDAPDAWQALALALAVNHVAGFQVAAPALPDLSMRLMLGANQFDMSPSSAKRGRGRPRKAVGGLLSILAAAQSKRPAHRPPMYTVDEKRAMVQDFERRIADAKAKRPSLMTQKAAAEREFGEDATFLLAVVRRFKRELASVEKSEKFADAERILRGLGRPT